MHCAGPPADNRTKPRTIIVIPLNRHGALR
jgi:hypothetical protein